MELKDFFRTPEELENAKKYVEIFYDKILISSKLSNPEALLLCAYMIANHEKTSSPQIDKVKSLFLQSGRNEREFSKALYELINRQKPPKLKKNDNRLEFTSAGIDTIRKLLEEGED
ncbi:MAG: hypothetical protein RQ930_04260 [Candidatus Aenigmarchaeota archaeon]|nr:hypothetical protein [Candidatus Aenigmarchaeota archaeon]